MRTIFYYSILIMSIIVAFPYSGSAQSNGIERHEELLGTWIGEFNESTIEGTVWGYYEDMSEPPTKEVVKNGVKSIINKYGSGSYIVIITKDDIRYSIPKLSTDLNIKHKYRISDGFIKKSFMGIDLSDYDRSIYVDDSLMFTFSDGTNESEEDTEPEYPYLLYRIDLDEDLWIGSVQSLFVELKKVQ